MRTATLHWTEADGWAQQDFPLAQSAQLLLLFVSNQLDRSGQKVLGELAHAYPNARIVGCTTAGEILQTQVYENSIAGVAIEFSTSQIQIVTAEISQENSSLTAREIIGQLEMDGLRFLWLLSEGINVNGSDLVNEFECCLPENVVVSGGLSADGELFQQTRLFLDQQVLDRHVIAVGFYGDQLEVGHGSLGGWDTFGPVRKITHSEANILFELDDESALELYKRYLGDYAEDLPSSGLLFPLALVDEQQSAEPVVRTLLAVSEEEGSMTFAGNMPQGAKTRLMKANFDRLIDGATGAAEQCLQHSENAALALLVSCVGRKMVLGPRVDEEVEAVRGVLGDNTDLVGFYSYGEISPLSDGCNTLHNQTMTITTLSERADA